ncbi:ABC transporter substrate-binding protein [Candidatus Saccharibacteria bacterium]|nr:ABC transporter substrate-binding protein [Candidatus Saccharibacteria bacterium]
MPDESTKEENKNIETTDDTESLNPHVAGDVFHPDNATDAEPEATPENENITDSATQSNPVEQLEKPEAPNGLLAIPPQPVKKSSKKGLLTFIFVLVLALAAAGAWWFLRDKNSANNSQTKASQELQEVDLIRIGTTDGPANNLFPKEGIGISYSQSRQVYEGLVGNKDKSYVPLLATSWTNPDEKTWVFKLKPGVKFHTGKLLTAADVKSSIEELQKLDFLGYLYATIENVEVVNDLEVRITTKEPDALLLNRLAISYIWDQNAKDIEGNNGTGPYKLDTTAAYEESTATLIANDDYHQGRPKTRKLVYKIYESDAKMNTAMKANELDQMETVLNTEAVAGLSEAGFAKLEFESPGTFGLYMNTLRANSPLKNKEVRKAIAQAIDRKSLVETVGNNNLPASQIIPKSLPGYDATVSFPEFNIAAAKDTLAKAGFPNGVTLEYLYIKDIQLEPPVVIKQLEAAGFKIKAVSFTELDPVLDRSYAGQFDLFSAAYTSDLADSRDLLGALLESSEQSYPVYSDTTFDKLLEDSDRELDPTKRIAILQAANKYATDNLLWIPLRTTAYVSFYQSNLSLSQDFNGGGTLGVYYWKVGQKPVN